MGAETARHVSAFRAFRTRLRDAFATYRGPYVSIDVLLTWGTTRFSHLTVRHEPRAMGASNYTIRKLVTHAFNMMTGFSTLPLQIASVIGFLFTFLGFLILLYVLISYLTNGAVVPGFAFLASIIAIFSGAQLFALGIIGEYLARMHFRSHGSPDLPGPGGDRRRMSLEGSARFEGAGAILECSLVPWDTEIFGFPVAQIDRIELAEGADPAEALDGLRWLVRRASRAPDLVPAGPRPASRVDGPRGCRLPLRGDGLRPAVRSVRRDRHAPPRRAARRGDGSGCRRHRSHRVLGLHDRAVPARRTPRSGAEPPQVRDVGADELRVGPPDGAQGGARRSARRLPHRGASPRRERVLAPHRDRARVAGPGHRHERLADGCSSAIERRARRPSRRRSPVTTCRSSTSTRGWASRSRRPR